MTLRDLEIDLYQTGVQDGESLSDDILIRYQRELHAVHQALNNARQENEWIHKAYTHNLRMFAWAQFVIMGLLVAAVMGWVR